jgi:hypothetical protein
LHQFCQANSRGQSENDSKRKWHSWVHRDLNILQQIDLQGLLCAINVCRWAKVTISSEASNNQCMYCRAILFGTIWTFFTIIHKEFCGKLWKNI